MADYFPVLSRAVAGLESNTSEARRAVYDRARAAIVRQLRAIDPPIAEEDISRERMQLEEAIRRVEASAGGASAAAPKPAAPSPAGPQAPSPAPDAASGAQGGDARKAAPATPDERPSPAPRTPPPAQSTPGEARAEPRDDAAAPDRPRRRDGQGEQKRADRPAGKQARPATRADGRPIIRAAGETGGAAKSKRSGPMIAMALVALVMVGVGAYAARGPIAALFGEKTVETAAVPPSEAPADVKPPEETKPAVAADDKSGDRLPQDTAAADRPAGDEPITGGGPGPQPPPASPTPPPAEQEVARAPEPTATPPAAEPGRPAETPAPAAPGGAPLVAQRAVLYEEGPNQQSGEALQGTILWRTESVSGGQNQPLETALRGEIDIPGRKIRATLTLRRNADPTLPASHTIEIQFTLPDDFPNAGISNVPGVLMKADESARGTAVAGLSVRVTNGFFLIGLSNLDTERTVNEQLLRDRGWIDIPILYDNGRRAVLTLEKGTPGSQAFQDAFAAWRSASAANPAPGGGGAP